MNNLKELFRLMSLTTAWHALGTMAEHRLGAENALYEEVPRFNMADMQAYEEEVHLYIKNLEVAHKEKQEIYMIGYAQLLAFAGLWSLLITVVWSIPVWVARPGWYAPVACLVFAASISAWEWYNTFPARVLLREGKKRLQAEGAKRLLQTDPVSGQEPKEP